MTSVYQSCGKAKDPERKPGRNIGTRTPTTLLLPLLEPLSFLFIQHQNPSSRIFIIVASSPHLHFFISNPLEFLSFFLDSSYKLVASFSPLKIVTRFAVLDNPSLTACDAPPGARLNNPQLRTIRDSG
jgi:hypothetical protein